MKYFDKFLSVLKTDRNTFVSYILLLISLFLLIDRVFETLLIIFTGIGYHYFGPIEYSIMYICIILTYLFALASKFVKSDPDKMHWFYWYCISLYITTISVVIQSINYVFWVFLVQLPNYVNFINDFSYLIKPALSALAVAIPIGSWYSIFTKLYTGVADSQLVSDSISDYGGISLSKNTTDYGPYTDEILLGPDSNSGKKMKLCASKRFEHTLVVGITGAGKTSLIFEPWIAQDISKKAFYVEVSKAFAFTALKNGLCTLNSPYSNEYLNKNLSLNMLIPIDSKKKMFNSLVGKLILDESGNKTVYKNLGLTYIAANGESLEKMEKVCQSFNISYNLIDPFNDDTLGLNPFALEDPSSAAGAIESVISGIFPELVNSKTHPLIQNSIVLIIRNLSIIFKVIYQKENEGKIPTLEDLLKFMNDFNLIEQYGNEFEKTPEAKVFEQSLSFVKANFYKDGSNTQETKKIVHIATGILQTMVSSAKVNKVICNRNKNLDFVKMLEEGSVNLLVTRRGGIGEAAHKLLGLFYLLQLKSAVLKRPGTEKNRVPHYLYIDEAAPFLIPATEVMFTVYRKFKVATIISTQNLAQITANSALGNTIISNCRNKIVFGNNLPAENEWWSKELGEERKWRVEASGFNLETEKYESKASAKYKFETKYAPGKIQSLGFKQCFYKLAKPNGKFDKGIAKLDFLSGKYTTKQKIKEYDFRQFLSEISNGESLKQSSVHSDGPIIMNPKKI